MAYVVTRPCRIGDLREPGYVLTAVDMKGRNLRHMEDVDRCIRFDPSVPDPEVPAVSEDGDSEDLGGLSLKDLKARAADLGVEDADKLRSKADAIAAIQAAGDSDGAEDGDSEEDSSEDDSSSEE